MSESVSVPPAARSWRDIPQDITPRAMSPVGRRRMTWGIVKTVAMLVIVAALAFGGWEVWRTWQANPQVISGAGNSEPLRHITMRTDGVLDQAWVESTLALPEGVGMMDLDLYALREQLTASGQVATAVLTRNFPDTLEVVLVERSPVLRLRAPAGDGELRDFLLARDGTIYLGAGYREQLVDSLPWLAGMKLERDGFGFAPLADMGRVADLLATASSNAPRMYADWQVVSLERFETDGQILVKSGQVPQVIFGTREDFFTQVARLDLILDRMQRRPGEVVRSINLAIGPNQVPVAFESTFDPSLPVPPRSNRHLPTKS